MRSGGIAEAVAVAVAVEAGQQVAGYFHAVTISE